MHRPRHLRAHAAWLLTAALALAAGPALAAAGKVLFASGTVQVERGGTRPLAAGDSVEIGDVIVTGPAARAQLLMADGAKLALRAGTRFRIDALTLPAAATAPGQARATTSQGSSAATLLKGGFRTVTGSVGKANPAGYQVRTPVGVLGIRGTDYAAVFCSGDCSDAPGVRPGEAIRDGLYLGVYTTDGGGIVFTPDGGAPFTLNPGQFAFVPLRLPTPEQLQAPPPVIEGDGAGPLLLGTARGAGLPGGKAPAGAGPDDFSNRRAPADAPGRPTDPQAPGGNPSLNQPVEGTDANGGTVDLTGGVAPERALPERRDVAYSIGAIAQLVQFSDVESNQPTDYTLNTDGDLTGFAAGFPGPVQVDPARFDIGSSTLADSNGDAVTLLRWGRWTGGVATANVSGQTNTIDLLSRSLHWIVSADADTPPVLPVTGTASYTLVGGTAPTDSTGAVGTLGTATFNADFTNDLVDSTLALTIGVKDVTATGTGVIGAQLGLPAHQFGGSYTVGGTNNGTGQPITGTGGFTGFFSAAGNPTTPGVPGGAGLTYTLQDAADGTTIQGAAAFQAP